MPMEWFDNLNRRNNIDLDEVYRKIDFKKNDYDKSYQDNEITSLLITNAWERIALSQNAISNARQTGFFMETHRGVGGRPVARPNEKHMVLAMYNMINLPNLGTVLDYETPLRQPNVRVDRKNGKIDMIIKNKDDCILIVEAKNPESKELGVRAVMEIYTYLKILNLFMNNFRTEAIGKQDWGLRENFRIQPAVLTFIGTHSDSQLTDRGPNFKGLLNLILNDLAGMNYEPMVHVSLNSYSNHDLFFQNDRYVFNTQTWVPTINMNLL